MVGIVWMVGMVCKSVGHGMFDMTVCMVCMVCMVTMMDMECFLCKVGMVCVACMFGIVCIVGVVIMFHMYCMRGVYDRYDRYGMYGYYDGCYLGTQPIGGVERRRTGPYIYTHIIYYIYIICIWWLLFCHGGTPSHHPVQIWMTILVKPMVT